MSLCLFLRVLGCFIYFLASLFCHFVIVTYCDWLYRICCGLHITTAHSSQIRKFGHRHIIFGCNFQCFIFWLWSLINLSQVMLVLDLSMTMVLCITSYQFNSTIWFHFVELQTLKVVVNSVFLSVSVSESTNEQLNISILMYCWQIRVKNHILDTPTIHNSSSTCWYDYREKSIGRR